MRVESARPSPSGEGGWIHTLGDAVVPVPVANHPPNPRPNIDWERLLGKWRFNTQPGQLRRLATGLGVTTHSLERLGVVYAAQYKAWAFPMRNGRGYIIGVRLRNDAGQKWAVRGSRQGLFWPDMNTGTDPLVITEGPTAAAAVLDLGFDVIGRPSCSGGTCLLQQALERGPSRDVVILADRDEPKKRPDGTTWCPGQEGAGHLAQQLAGLTRSTRIIKPLKGKDARAWVQSGATRRVVDMVISNACFWRATNGR